jgi:hypothetical protein
MGGGTREPHHMLAKFYSLFKPIYFTHVVKRYKMGERGVGGRGGACFIFHRELCAGVYTPLPTNDPQLSGSR